MATTTAPPPPTALRIEIAPRTMLLVLAAIVGVWIVGQLTTAFTVITVALVLVGTFDPAVAWLERRGIKRGRALALIFIAAALALTGVVLLMVPPLMTEAADLVTNAPAARDHLVRALDGYAWAKPVIKAIHDIPLDDLGKRAAVSMLGFSTRLLMMFGYGLSAMFLAIYLLADPVRSKGFVYAVVPRHHHVKLARILLELKDIVGGYMRGQLITSLSMAGFVFVLLTIIGSPDAMALALFAGLTDIIPFVGGYVASTPVIVAASPHGTAATVVVFVLMVLYQEFESRILIPRVYGRQLRLPPAVVLVALLVGGTLGGILGALLALPIAAGLRMMLHELRVDLPGESPHADDDSVQEMDDRATAVYEELSEGQSAVDAGVIAEDLASMVKRTEGSDRSGPRRHTH